MSDEKYITLKKEEYDGLEREIENLKEVNKKLETYISQIKEVKERGGIRTETDNFHDPCTNRQIKATYKIIPQLRIAEYEVWG